MKQLDAFDTICKAYMLERFRPDIGGQLGFIQVGANDGTTLDKVYPLAKQFGWHGIVVEPQPEMCEKLRAAYAGMNVRVVQAAISDLTARRKLWRFKPGQGHPFIASMLASFNRGWVEQNAHGIKGEIEGIEVPGITVTDLLAGEDYSSFDLLNLDTEGFDNDILRQCGDINFLPAIIRWENPGHHEPPFLADYAIVHQEVDSIAYKGGKVSCDEAELCAAAEPGMSWCPRCAWIGLGTQCGRCHGPVKTKDTVCLSSVPDAV